MTNIIIENNEMTFPFDPVKKVELLKEELMDKVFGEHIPKVKVFIKVGKDYEERTMPKYEKNKIILTTKINDFLRKYKFVSKQEAEMGYTADLINECLNAFSDLVSWINDYTVFVPTKQLICAFMQITENTYNAMIKGRDEDIVTAMESIESYIVDLTFTSSQNDLVKEKSTLSRLKTKGMGHSLSETQSDQPVNTTFVLTNQAVLKKLEQIKNLEYRG